MRLMTGKRAETLLELMYRIEYFTLARAWEGLTDDEFFWEPFTTTWSIRRQGQCRTLNPFGAGEWVADFQIREPTPVPMTTIAWLYWHIGSMPGRLCDIDFMGGTRTMASAISTRGDRPTPPTRRLDRITDIIGGVPFRLQQDLSNEVKVTRRGILVWFA
jgi:hypothetical protein